VGFEKELAKQGFSNVRLLRTPAELKIAKIPKSGKKGGIWSGPWRTRYGWGTGADHEGDHPEDLRSARPAADPADLDDIEDL
jgi:hypothetical protein